MKYKTKSARSKKKQMSKVKSKIFKGLLMSDILLFKTIHSSTRRIFIFILIFFIGFGLGAITIHSFNNKYSVKKVIVQEVSVNVYWMKLLRVNHKEYLYHGIPGDESKSKLLKEFNVKVGIPGQRPTPLPQLIGRKYWKIIKKYSSIENPETSPYFLELDIPVDDYYFGPVPYKECGGEQCSWILPGKFGLHGVNNDNSRLTIADPGSSGCIRHTDEDITYLYNLLNVDEGVRYYVE